MGEEKPVIKRRLWNMVRIVYFLVRKGLLKRRYLQEDLMKRGKDFAHGLRSLIFHHSVPRSPAVVGRRDYEFSCSSTPAFKFSNKLRQQGHRDYFSCIRPSAVDSPKFAAVSLLDYRQNYAIADVLSGCDFSEDAEADARDAAETYDLAVGEDLGTPVYHTSTSGQEREVDREAEEFIAKFHSQIKFQRQVSFLQYEEMLARGAI